MSWFEVLRLVNVTLTAAGTFTFVAAAVFFVRRKHWITALLCLILFVSFGLIFSFVVTDLFLHMPWPPVWVIRVAVWPIYSGIIVAVIGAMQSEKDVDEAVTRLTL